MSTAPKPLSVTRHADGSATYTTLAGDVLDHLCWRHYGYEWDTPEATLSANPGLAALGVVLPAGVTVTFPLILKPATPIKARRRLFD